MDAMAGRKPAVVWALNISVIALVALWLFPTLGLFISSFRTGDQITASGWWSALFPAEQTMQIRVADPDDNRVDLGNGRFMVEGNIFDGAEFEGELNAWGTSSRRLGEFETGATADLGDGETLTLQADGAYVWEGNDDQISGRAQRVFLDVVTPPDFSLQNYNFVLFDENNSEGMAKAFFN
ncbi:MAG: carbohydrate ABC transporter permease, partial [Pseudomonadota bacterium]